MCGRFAFYDTADVYRRFSLKPSLLFPKNHNCTPGQSLPVITFINNYLLDLFRWGITPYWSMSKTKNLINIRSETLTQKTTFKKYFESQRCLIPANGFYEWGLSDGKKTPYFFTPSNSSYFVLAGLYDNNSFAIITTPPNSVVSPIHDRMPLILDNDKVDTWLDLSTPTNVLSKLMVPSPSTGLKLHSTSLLAGL
jgi:putative SOS response-associated peptidase YedK